VTYSTLCGLRNSFYVVRPAVTWVESFTKTRVWSELEPHLYMNQ